MNKQRQNYKRKTFLINPQFQLPFIANLCFISLLTITIFYLTTLYFFHRLKTIGHEAGLPNTHVFFDFISKQQGVLEKTFLLGSLVAFMWLFITGLLLSHRVAGPIERTKTHIEKILNGNFTDLEFRKNDYFQDLADSVNKLVQKIRSQK